MDSKQRLAACDMLRGSAKQQRNIAF